jgi:ATP-binding cassette subfamily B protein
VPIPVPLTGPRGAGRPRATRLPARRPGTLRRMLGYVRPMWPLLCVTLCLTLLTSALGQIPQLANRYLIDHVLVPGQARAGDQRALFDRPFTEAIRAVLHAGDLRPGAVQTLAVLALGLLGLRLFTSGVGFVQSYLTRILGQRLMYGLRRDVFRKVQYLSADFYIHAGIGQIMSRIMNDTGTVQNFVTSNLNQILGQLFTFGTSLLIMQALDPRLTDLLLLFGPPIVGCILIFNGTLRAANRLIRRQTARLMAAVHDALAGFITIKAFSVEEHVIGSFETENLALFGRQLALMRLQAAYTNTMGLVTGSSAAFFLLYGGLQVVHHQISLGTYVLVNGMRGSLFIPFTSFAGLAAQYQRAAAGAERIFEYLDTEASVRERPGAPVLGPLRGEVEFRDVVFHYPPEPEGSEDAGASPLAGAAAPGAGRDRSRRPAGAATRPAPLPRGEEAGAGGPDEEDEERAAPEPVPPPAALDGVSFRVEAGETVALVGPSGGGKSTVASLILRLYDPDSGAVLVDGHDVRDVDLHSLRSQIAVVLQDVYLFRGTIRDNVAFGLRDISPAEVDASLRAANAHFAWDLPEGPDTLVGEGGLRLSGGQRQRVAIARALARRPRILILDEATSAQDTRSEDAVMEALRGLQGGPTTIVIAHRLSTIVHADRILVLDRGRLVEQGRHAELLAADGLYAGLYAGRGGDVGGG